MPVSYCSQELFPAHIYLVPESSTSESTMAGGKQNSTSQQMQCTTEHFTYFLCQYIPAFLLRKNISHNTPVFKHSFGLSYPISLPLVLSLLTKNSD